MSQANAPWAIQQMRSTLDELESELGVPVTTERAAVQGLDEKLSQVVRDVASLRKQLNDPQLNGPDRCGERLERLEAGLRDLRSRMTDLQQDEAMTAAQAKQALGRVEDVEVQVLGRVEDLETKVSEVTTLRTNQLAGRVEDAEVGLSGLNAAHTALEARVVALEGQVRKVLARVPGAAVPAPAAPTLSWPTSRTNPGE